MIKNLSACVSEVHGGLSSCSVLVAAQTIHSSGVIPSHPRKLSVNWHVGASFWNSRARLGADIPLWVSKRGARDNRGGGRTKYCQGQVIGAYEGRLETRQKEVARD